MRIALGISYTGTVYQGWQSQPSGNTIQDHLEKALTQFMNVSKRVVIQCAGRTDAGVHALNQVVHFDTEVQREAFSWVRGCNRYLPADIAVQWCRFLSDDFHARNSALNRRYIYVVLESPIRPALEFGRVGWCWRPLNAQAMSQAALLLLGEHDFSAFRSSQCQALSPIKHLHQVSIRRNGTYWLFEFQANAFLHHMVRNIMGSLIAVGTGAKPVTWMAEILAAKNREFAAPTFSAGGLYFLGPQYDRHWQIPDNHSALNGIPGYVHP